jgi:predicted Zn-dependent protease
MTDDEHIFLALMGYVFLQNARPDKAAVMFSALDTLQPAVPRVLRGLALAQLRSDKPQRALDTLDRLAMAGGVDASFHLLRAQALGALARDEEAAQAMKTFVHLRGEAVKPA